MANGKEWTAGEEAKAVDMMLRRVPYKVIAKACGRTLTAVSQRLTKIRKGRLGFIPRYERIHKPGELSAWVKRLSVPGVSDTVIGEILGVERRTVGETRRRLGLPAWKTKPGPMPALRSLPENFTREQLVAGFLRAYSGVGRSDADIARVLGIDKNRVMRVRKEFGLVALGHKGKSCTCIREM